MRIEFGNWDEYQTESKRVKNPSWFRFENKTYMDRVWEELDHTTGEFSAFMFLLMFVSQNGNETGSVDTEPKILARLSGLPETLIIKTINKLSTMGILTCPDISGYIATLPDVSRLQDKTRHNNTKHSSRGGALSLAPTAVATVESPQTLPVPKSRGKPVVSGKQVSEALAAYIRAYRQRYRADPHRSGKLQGQLRTLIRDAGSVQRACDLIQVYLQIDDPWFVKKHHDLGTLLENANKICTALQTGTNPEGVDWSKVFDDPGTIQDTS